MATATYSATDQVLTWSGVSSTVDDASNITYDPASGLALAWTARNQMAAASEGVLETYDGLGRRETSTGTGGGYTLDFEHDGATMIGWTSISLGAFYDFMNIPGGGALAGSFTSGGSTTTWVPLLDASGSTIALVNAASTGSGPATTYSYDPAGTASASGAANDWPFLYQGGEKEVSDPGPLYYSGGGQFYSPQLVRSLSETSQTSSQGSGGPAGKAIAGPPGGGNGSFGHWYVRNVLEPMEPGQFNAGDLPDIFVGDSEGGYVIPVGEIAQFIEEWVSFFEWLFGGGSAPTPRQLLHARHPLYPVILGVTDGLIPTEASEGKCKFCGDPSPCPNARPLQKKSDAPPKSTVSCQAQMILLALRCGHDVAIEIGPLVASLWACGTAGEVPGGPVSAGGCAAIVSVVLGPPSVAVAGLTINECLKESRDLEQSCGQ